MKEISRLTRSIGVCLLVAVISISIPPLRAMALSNNVITGVGRTVIIGQNGIQVSRGALVATAPASPACVPPPLGLVSWWPGDGNAKDIADGNDGTLMNGAGFADGEVGKAFALDGVNQYVSVPDSASLSFTGSFTIDAWIRLTSYSPEFAPVVSKWNDLRNDLGEFQDQRSYFLAVINGVLSFFVSSNGAASGDSFVFSLAPVPTGTFTHVAGVFNSDLQTIQVYVNGVPSGVMSTSSSTVFDNAEPLLIGAGDLGSNVRDFTNGLIDEVEVFNRALTPVAIHDIFNAGSAGKCKTASPPATLALTPAAATNAVGDQHCVTATVKDASGNATPNVTVVFNVVGAQTTFSTPSSGSASTNSAGEARFCFTAALPGSNGIYAFADTNTNGTRDPGEPFGDANKTWLPPTSTQLCEVTITDGGWIMADNGDRASFGGNAKVLLDGTPQGQQDYQDRGPAQPLNVHSIQITATTCNGARTTASIFGRATIDGAGSHVFRIDVTDMSKLGGTDTYGVMLDTAYLSGQHSLSGGQITIH